MKLAAHPTPATGHVTRLATLASLTLGLAFTGCGVEYESTLEAVEESTAEIAAVTLDIHEWPVPWEQTRPRDPYVSPDGSVWFVGQRDDYAAQLHPDTGRMQRFDLPDGAGPHTVIVDADGYPWYAGNRDRHIGRVDPETGEIARYDMPEGVNDPHTMGWTSDGRIWFTAQRSQPAGYIGRFDPDTGQTEVVDVPGQMMRPYGLVVDDNDQPWIAFMGSNAIGTVDPETLELEIIETPYEGSRIRRLALSSDGRVWWVDAVAGYMGVYDPADQSMNQWQTPGGEGAGLYAAAMDEHDRFWYVETGLSPNRFIGFDTDSEEFFAEVDVPSGGGAVRHMVFDPDANAIWFGTDADTVGRASIR